MKILNNREPYMHICLCKRCASVYFNDEKYWIEKANEYQYVLDECDICKQFKGFDYKIWKLSNMGFAKSHNCGGKR